jgi:two-component system osmolarity sensor histidine kinase EnvZ
MSSRPIDALLPAERTDDIASAAADASGEAPATAHTGAGGRQGWLKRLLPRTLFGRSLLIIVTPLILLQIIATWFFYDRHWNTIARRLSAGIAGEIAQTIGSLAMASDETEWAIVLETARKATDLRYTFQYGARLPAGKPQRLTEPSIAQPLAVALNERVGRPFVIDVTPSAPRSVLVTIQLGDGTLTVAAPRERLATSTTYIFMLWMVGSSIVLFAVATIFMRNQVRSLRRLAAAAESFGKGRSVPNFRLEGAAEIRRAGAAFLVMRNRIQRQISQRTEMLAGVSHDLRTPLTRMKLALALMDEHPAIDELRSDVSEMERMIQGYLDFARGEGSETPVETDLPALLEQVAAEARRDGAAVTVTAPDECLVLLRPNAFKRCLVNLVGNARRHGMHVWITLHRAANGIEVLVDDDGTGIPPEHREAVFRPFFRLDPSRNVLTGGVGLGLTIARDVARGHGGDLTLDTAPQGGLRARVYLPL